MLRIVDNTLTGFDGCLPSKEDLHTFCNMLVAIGVDVVELSVPVYEKMEKLPREGNYILHITLPEEVDAYPGFTRYTCHYFNNQEQIMAEIQINDIREIVKLKAFHGINEVRIVGLDDLFCFSHDKIMQEMKKNLPNTRINFCPENTYHCASALAIQWLLNYGKDVTTSFAGFKNNGATEEVIMALRLTARHKPNRELTILPEMAKLFEKMSGKKLSNKKPVIGKEIFKVESGIHADGIQKNPANYEAYDPGCVGGKSQIVIGKHSGIKAVKLKLSERGLSIPEDKVIIKILNLIKEVSTNKGTSLSDNEFESLALEVISHERDQIYC